MIVVLTPNPAIDLTWEVDQLTPGGSHRTDAGIGRAGGKGMNVMRVVHAESERVHAIAAVGGLTGEQFRSDVVRSKLPVTLVPVAAPTRRTMTIVDELEGDATIILERGISPTVSEWADIRAAVSEWLPKAVVFVISGGFPPNTPDGLLGELVAEGRSYGIPVIVDSSREALLQAADAGASLLKPNISELLEATGVNSPLAGARMLLERGAERVLVSRGGEGMMLVTPEHVIRAWLPKPLYGNPTGAGDAAVAACAVLLAEGNTDDETLIRRATAWSAAAVLMPLAGDVSARWPQLERDVVISEDAPREEQDE